MWIKFFYQVPLYKDKKCYLMSGRVDGKDFLNVLFLITGRIYGNRIRCSTTMMERYSCAVMFTHNHGPRGSRAYIQMYKCKNNKKIINYNQKEQFRWLEMQ